MNLLKLGIKHALGKYLFMCDADLSMPINEIANFLPPKLERFDVAIGSRNAPTSHRHNEPFLTHLRGRIFSNVVKLLVFSDFEDTQCGFKCFTAEVAKDLFENQISDDMSFDVEVIFLAKKRGYIIIEVPINWYFNRDSKVRMFRDSLSMFCNILTVKYNWWRGKYNQKNKCELVEKYDK